MLPWAACIALAVVFIGVGVYLIGARLPETHVAEVSGVIPHHPPQEVVALVREVERYGTWRQGVSVTVLARHGYSTTFRESGPDGTLTYRQTETVPGTEVINEIVGDGLPYGGAWTITVAPAEDGSTVRIREAGFVKPPVFRFLARFVFGYTRSMTLYLKELIAASDTEGAFLEPKRTV